MRQPTLLNGRAAAYILWMTIALLGFSGSAHAACSANSDVFLRFPAPTNLSIPRDAAEGTVLHRATIGIQQIYFSCSTSEPWGFRVSPSRGSQPVSPEINLPTGAPGLSFKIKINGSNGFYVGAFRMLDAGLYSISDSVTLEIIKSNELTPSSSIKAGPIGSLMFGPSTILSISLQNSVNVVAASCESPSVNVEMGDDYHIFQLDTPGIAPRAVPFSLKLVNCPKGIAKVNYKLEALTPIVDAARGVVELNSRSSASGVGLQVKDGSGNPLALNVPHNFSAYDSQGGSFLIPLSASYYRLENRPMRPGTANTELTFIMSYL